MPLFVAVLIATLTVGFVFAEPGVRRKSTSPLAEFEVDELAPLPGPLLLAGEGEPSPAVLSAFVDMAGGGAANIVVLAGSAKAGKAIDWVEGGARAQEVVTVRRAKELGDPEDLAKLLAADGLWLEELPEKLVADPLLRALLVNALERGAAVGARGDLARALTGVPGVDDDRLCLAARLELLAAPAGGDEDAAQRAALERPARIVTALPEGAALAIHHGRRIALLGEGQVAFAIMRANDELMREQVLSAKEERDGGDPLGYRLDFLSWVRCARAAERPPFPPAEPKDPSLAKGALLVQGGGGVNEETWERFIELAGGKDAQIVCIPSAGEMDDDEQPSSYSARELEERGCSSVAIVHAAQRERATIDERWLRRIDECDAVWIDGGRTYRFMDRFGETPAAEALARVLERGGVVAGSSAGAQVIGQFLVRGNPRSNREMTDKGYLVGLELLKGVVIDAHFRDRERGPELRALVQEHPQLLGLGVDAGAALVIQGSIGEVLGEAGVVVYDARAGDDLPEDGLVLESGASFDLVEGALLE